jgi:hypothetical protein
VLSVESAGHFNDDGTGNVAIKVTSAEAPKEAQTEPAAAAPETPPAAEPETPPEEAPAGKQPE